MRAHSGMGNRRRVLRCAAGRLAVAFSVEDRSGDMAALNWRARWEEDADGGMSVLLERNPKET